MTVPLAVMAAIGWQWLVAQLPRWFSAAVLGSVAGMLSISWFLQTQFVRRLRRKVRVAAARGDVAPVLKVLFTNWDSRGILASEAATGREIKAFEKQYGVVLPDALRAYFKTVNGTKAGELGRDDGNQIGFWHFDQVRTFGEARISEGPDADRLFAFADHSLRSATYGVRLSPDSAAPAPVVVRYPHGHVQVAASFCEFLERYVSGDATVVFPRVAIVADDEGIGPELDGVLMYTVRWKNIRRIAVEVAIVEETGSADALWAIEHTEALRPFLVPVELIAGGHELRARVRSLEGFDEHAFRDARDAETRGEGGTFPVWRNPVLPHDEPEPKLPSVSSADVDELRRRCREADAWCASRTGAGLRTFAPVPELLPTMPIVAELRAAVETVARRRRESVEIPGGSEPAGRVLVAVYDMSSGAEPDGAAQAFLDQKGRPPSDSWLWVVDWQDPVILLAWVPQVYEEEVEAALEACPDAPICWLDDAPRWHPEVKAFHAATTRELALPRPWKSADTDPERAVRKRRQAGF